MIKIKKKMKILTLVDSFKSSLTAEEIKEVLKTKALKYNFAIDSYPMSDGGEGFLTTLKYIFNESFNYIEITSFNKLIKVPYIIYKDKVYLESATIIGLNITKTNPLTNLSNGLGEILKKLYEMGYKNFVIGLGGTATTDFGLGVLKEFDVKFYNKNNDLIKNIKLTELVDVYKIDITSLNKYSDLNVEIITDVTNKALGKKGATHVFAKQKGASDKDIKIIEKNVKNLIKRLIEANALDATNFKSSGAAGGLGFMFMSLFNAKVNLGTPYILNLLNFTEINNNYDLIITGEGKLDKQSLDGKVVFEIIKQTNKETIIISAINELNLKDIKKDFHNVVDIYSIVPSITTKEKAIKEGLRYFEQLVDNLFMEIYNIYKEKGGYYER